MPNEVVVSQQTTPPSVYMTSTLYDMLSAWFAVLLAATIFCKLFVNAIIVTAATALADLVEANAPGYSAIPVTSISGPFIDQFGNAYGSTGSLTFTTTGGGANNCQGEYLVQATGAPATVTFTLAGGAYTVPVITSGGAGYLVPPLVTITGVTGSGAVITTEITDGVVTAINIVSPGVGYTTATATIEPPFKLIQAANFPTPLPLKVVTDAVSVVVELDQIAAAA